MNRGDAPKKALSPALGTGIAAFALSGALLALRPDLAVLPLGLFVVVCFAASLFPGAGFFLTVTSRGSGEGRAVALSFDDGPDPEVTPLLLDLLDRHRLGAAFFVIGEKAGRHPGLVRETLRRGHEVANHSYRHDPLLMFRSRLRIRDEISRTQEALALAGIRPRVFRPPVGVTGPRLAGVLAELGLECVTFSCRAADFGNRRIASLGRTILRRVRPGAIILFHDVSPPGTGRVAEWLAQVEAVIAGLRAGGYEIVPLSVLIGRAVMERLPQPAGDFSLTPDPS
ncbi:MAG: polysaccharide deacetylase family protein [Syntrophales bacterium]